jgi:EmrB/QacA subfamily drug resistance transporter
MPDAGQRADPRERTGCLGVLGVINSRARPCDEAAIRAVRPVRNCAANEKSWVLVATILGSSIAFIDESVVNVALPAIETDLGASVEVIQWLINAYTLCLTALLLVGGAAGDRFGRRLIFVLGTGIFAAASVGCGLSPGVTPLILARAVQGIGAALLVPCSLAIIGASFEEAERGKAIGTWAGFSAIAAAVGPLLGGWIVDHATWRWIFLINPLLAVPTIFVALYRVPESRDPQARGGLDWRGALLAFAGLGSVVFGLMATPVRGLADTTVVASIVLGSGLLVAFLWEEARSRVPMMPLGLFRSRIFGTVNLLTLLLYAALGGAFFFLPFELIQVRGYSAAFAGAVFLPFTIVMAALSRWSGGLLDRYGARGPLVVGPTITALGFGLLALPGADDSPWTLLLAMTVLGIGMAVSVAPLTTTVINAVPTHQAGVASGINNAVASLANLLAVAVLGAAALGHYNHALDQRLVTLTVPEDVRAAIQDARGKFVIAPALEHVQGDDRGLAAAVVKESLADSIRLMMGIAAALALAAAISAALGLRSGDDRHGRA